MNRLTTVHGSCRKNLPTVVMQHLSIPYDIFTTCIISHPDTSKAILDWNQRDLFSIIASFTLLSRTLEDESEYLKDKKSAFCETKFVKT
jgi:hypothetical protein